MTKSKILIVDDNEENLSVLGNLLINKGFIVQIAQNGEIAIKTANRKLPDLILLDISMPGMSGYQVCKILKNSSKTSEIPIIFLTAHIETKDIVKGFELGAVDYITKPFNEAELIARVLTHLELKHSRTALNQKNEQLEVLNATKDKFFSIIAHDLRGPFTGIIGLAEMLIGRIKSKEYDDAEKYCELIHESSQHSFDLLNNLLQWARTQTGRIEFNPELLYLDFILKNISDLLKATYKEKNINLSIIVEPNLMVVADSFMIETIIRNLLSNAIKYTRNNGKIDVIAINQDGEIEISVKDNGVGISQENIEKLFKIESNYSTKGTNDEEGTGLGLILCKEFVEKHGGKMWIESYENMGAKFSFTIKN